MTKAQLEKEIRRLKRVNKREVEGSFTVGWNACQSTHTPVVAKQILADLQGFNKSRPYRQDIGLEAVIEFIKNKYIKEFKGSFKPPQHE